jgi:hypothetical protein
MMKYLVPILVFLSLLPTPARGHDDEQPELNGWYAALTQPNNPSASCCGYADAYWCDILETESGRSEDGKTFEVKNFCYITDDRKIPGRPHIDVGTRIEIPMEKIKWGPNDPQTSSPVQIERNPTPHNIVFLSRGLWVYCFVMGAGV